MSLLPSEQMDVQTALADEEEFGWVVEECCCDRCGREWVAVYPLGMKAIGCPGCEYEQPTQEPLTQ